MSYPPEAQEKACVWAPQAQQAASPSLQNGPPRLFQREPRVIRVLHQQSHRAESLRAPRGRLIMTERKAAPEGTALHSLVSKREPLSFWQAVTEKSTAFRKLRTGFRRGRGSGGGGAPEQGQAEWQNSQGNWDPPSGQVCQPSGQTPARPPRALHVATKAIPMETDKPATHTHRM